MPPPPGLPPVPGGPGLAAPAAAPPPQLVAQIAQATGAPPDVVTAFLQYVAQQAPQALQQILRMPPQQLAQIMAEFAQSPAGVQGGPPPGPPPGPQGPPQQPVDAAGNPMPWSPADGPPPQPVPPPPPLAQRTMQQAAQRQRQPGQQQPGQKKLRKPKAPSWEPDELPEPRYGKSGPPLKTVWEHADEGKEFFRELTKALQEWRDIYHMAEDREQLDGTPADQYQGERPVTRAQPVTMANRIVGLTSPSLDRLGIQADPWADDDETKEAAQQTENYARYALESIYRRWNRRATTGDYQPPFERKIAGLDVIEGGFAFRVMPAPERKDFPWDVDLVPLMEIFARPLSTTRQVTCSLAEAYVYEQVRELLPPPDKESQADPGYTSASRVDLITWTDETHWCMALRFADPDLRQKQVTRNGVSELWVYEPKPHGLGRRIYLVPNPWDATPLGPSAGDKGSRARHLSRGVYWSLGPTIKLVNQIVGALRNGVFKNINRPLKIKTDPALRAQLGLPAWSQAMYDQAHQAGGTVVLAPGEDVEDIISDLMQSPDGQALMQSLLGDLGDAAPPVMGGRGAAQSGFDRFQASEAAGVLHVDPIIAHLTGALEYLIETILTDLARLGEGDKRLFTKLPYRVYRVKPGSTKRGGYMATLDAKAVRRNGPYVRIKFKRDSLTERMQLAQLHTMLIHEHLESRLHAMDELGIDDTERENAQMLAEAVLNSPAVVKSAMRTALMQQAAEAAQDPDGDVNWSRVMLDALEEELAREPQQGQQPGQPGMPSPAGAPGGGSPPPPPMPGSSAPGLPPVMAGE